MESGNEGRDRQILCSVSRRKRIRTKYLSARVVESVLVQRPLLTNKNLFAIAQTVVLLFPELSQARLFSDSLQQNKKQKILPR